MRRAVLLLLVVLTAGATLPVRAGATIIDASSIRPAALAPRLPRDATRIGELPADQRMTFDVVLPPSNPRELSSLLDALSDAGSPQYHHWLAPGEFARRFGPSRAQVNAIINWLHDVGLHDAHLVGNRVEVHAAAGLAARALDVTFVRYRLPDGRDGFATRQAPVVPRAIAETITAITGLSDTTRFHPHHTNHPATTRARAHALPAVVPHASTCETNVTLLSNSNGFWVPRQVGAVYGLDGLFAAGQLGAGKTIAVYELSPHKPADTNTYLQCFGLHNSVTTKKIDGGGTADPDGTEEANLDIEAAATHAPGAKIVSYEGPNTTSGVLGVWSAIVNDDVADVVSTSWGLCEPDVGASELAALHAQFLQAATQGQTIFAASGDDGSEGCFSSDLSSALAADSPANDPLVTGVGGTLLFDAEVDNPDHEPVWNDCQDLVGAGCAFSGGGASGGGLSTTFQKPSWQPTSVAHTCGGTGCRQVPDISVNAGIGEAFNSDGWTFINGTSIASPLLAGLAADTDTACVSGRIGDFAPKLAALAAKNVYGIALRDVPAGQGDIDLTRNHAAKYPTAARFDMATGFGTPIATGLSCPQITAVHPTSARPGQRVTVTGFALQRATIRFGTVAAPVESASATTATVVVPSGSGGVQVSAINPMGAGTHTAVFRYPGRPSPPGASSYRTVAADGGIFSFGAAAFYGSPASTPTRAPIVGIAVDKATRGYWLAAADGTVYNFNAPALGSLAGTHLNQPIVGIAATADGSGYWLVASDGGIFAFGTARFHGSTGSKHLNRPIVGIATDAATGGYWLVASDGGIFAFDAPFRGSTGATHLNQPIVGIAATADGSGYWLVASDGGVFAFDAPFYGSTGAIPLNQPIVGIAATGDAHGYWFVARDGGVFAFGDAPFSGSAAGSPINQPMVAIARDR